MGDYLSLLRNDTEVRCAENRRKCENTVSTTFIAAASNGQIERLKALLKSGGGVKRVDLNKALCGTAFHGQDDCLEMLIEAGADVNVNPVISETFTPLEGAVRRGFDRCVKLLIQAGADVKRRGNFALKEGATHGKVECCDLLLQAGVDVNTAGFRGVTPLMSAAAGFYGPVKPHKNLVNCPPLFLRRKAQINQINADGWNAITTHLMSMSRNKTMVLLLHAAGEKIDGTTLADGSVPDYLQNKDLRLCLKHLCRETIRKHLLDLDPHEHLFDRVPRLGLPALLTDYLLYGISLDEEEQLQMD